MGEGSGSKSVGDSGHTTPRRLYRQGSTASQFSADGIPLQGLQKDGLGSNGHHMGSTNSGLSRRSRTPSGKSIKSRTASRAEYHMDLKAELDQNLTPKLIYSSFLIMFGSSFLFGYNIGCLNQPSDLIKDFFNRTYTERTGEPVTQGTITFLWSLTTTLYLPGGMIGAFAAGFLADKIGRKRAVLFSHIFAFIGAILSCSCVAAKMPELLMAGRFVTGINCGFATQLAPMYLMEITPFNWRGAFGTGHQLFITIGIFMGALFGLREILGTAEGWPFILLINAVPAFVSLVLLPFIPDSPRYLMIVKKKRIAAEKALRYFRQKLDVMADVEEMETECDESEEKDDGYTMKQLLKTKELHVPLIIACMLQVVQQLSGINAIFFYSSSIYTNAGVDADKIQYAVLGTNAVNVFMTIICVPIMDKLGRRPLLLYPMIVMTFTLALMTMSLNLQPTIQWMSYISIMCVILYVVCFAVGLGPIPTMIGAELFRQGPRPRAMSLAGLTNWMFTIIVAISFESVQEIAEEFTFLIFLVLMIVFTVFVYFKVPETKNKTFEEIASQFLKGDDIEVEEIIDDDVFSPELLKENEKSSLMEDRNGHTNSSDVQVKVPEERQQLTKSMENVQDLEV